MEIRMKNHELRVYTNKTKLSEIIQFEFPIIEIRIDDEIISSEIDEVFIKPNRVSFVAIHAIIKDDCESVFNYYVTNLEQEKVSDSKVIEVIKKHGLLIGSRKWGGANEDSDYDYAFPHYNLKELMRYIPNDDLQIGMYSKNRMRNTFSFYVTLNNKVFNLIVYAYMEIVYRLNAEMDKRLLDDNFKEKMSNKVFRVQQFEEIINNV